MVGKDRRGGGNQEAIKFGSEGGVHRGVLNENEEKERGEESVFEPLALRNPSVEGRKRICSINRTLTGYNAGASIVNAERKCRSTCIELACR